MIQKYNISKEGKCDWCGTDGWCCKKTFVGNGCDGTFGGINQHTCTLKPKNGNYVVVGHP